MKKTLALVLAVAMMFAMALPMFAETTTRYGQGNDDVASDNYTVPADDTQTDKQTELKYGVAQAYTVSIPAALELHEAHDTADGKTVGYVYNNYKIAVSDVVIAGTEVLNIYVAGADEDSFVLAAQQDGNADVDYYVTTGAYYTFAEGATSIAPGDDGATSLVLTCEADEGNDGTKGTEAEAQIYFSSKGTAQEGVYMDTLTFTVRVQNA